MESPGTLRFLATIGPNAFEMLVDYDAQMLHVEEMGISPAEPYAYAAREVYFWDGSELKTLPREANILPIAARWDSAEDRILLAYRRGSDAFLGWMDEETAEVQEISRYEDFLLGFASISPDGRYFLLREEGLVRPIPLAQPMLLIDSQTLEMVDFGSPVFGYWSPDSRFLALGYKEAERYESRVLRYELATGEMLDYPVVASQEDTPFFYENGFRSNGVLWSPDSQRLVVLNRDTESLYFLAQDGSVSQVSGGRITPLRWSPDSRFLLGIGYANGEAGAFIVDVDAGAFHRLQSPVLLQDALSDFAWSPNSRYVAVLTHSPGVLFEQRLVLYDTEGQMVGSVFDLSWSRSFATVDGSLRWVE